MIKLLNNYMMGIVFKGSLSLCCKFGRDIGSILRQKRIEPFLVAKNREHYDFKRSSRLIIVQYRRKIFCKQIVGNPLDDADFA